MRKRRNDYRNIIPDPEIPERIPGMKKITKSEFFIDYSVFKKTPEEKLRLKAEKARHRRQLLQR
ncbi:MAG TPA: hypothetical protein DCX95_01160 [Elusimicrobia bacterium]|nr:hypothetical protein [Elusimicrobiota bacterium]